MSTAPVTSDTPKKRPIYELLSHPRATQVLPSLTALVKQLEEIAKQQNVAVQEISKFIRYDQSMAVRIIRLANSAYFAPAQPIVDLDDAIIYLGLSNVRTVILTTQCIEKTCAVPSEVFPWREFWLHSAAVGAISRTLAGFMRKTSNAPPPEELLYVMGLLHDIGKLALACLSPSDFINVIEESGRKQCPTSDVEGELLGLDHATIGAWYLQQQGMPPELFEAVRLHHAWHLDPINNCYPCILSLADKLAHRTGLGHSGSILSQEDEIEQMLEWTLCVENFWEPETSPHFYAKEIENELEKLPNLIRTLTR